MRYIYRLQFISILLLLLLSVGMVKNIISNHRSAWLKVQPTGQYLQKNNPVAKYGQNNIYLEGKMELSGLNFWQCALIPTEGNPDIIQWLFLISYLLIIIYNIFRFDEKRFFAKELSNTITILANGILLYLFITFLQSQHLNNMVEHITNKDFELSNPAPNLTSLALLFSMALLKIIARLFKRSHQLQLENDLTV